MNTLAKYFATSIIALFVHVSNAQTNNKDMVEGLKREREYVEKKEREHLEIEVEQINERLENNEISRETAERLKKKAAQKRALNIKNKIAILDNKIELLERNYEGYNDETGEVSTIEISATKIGLDLKEDNEPLRYDARTYSTSLLAIGLNNAITEGEGLNNSPYNVGGSRFFEMGWAAKTRVFKNTNVMRLVYGATLQFNSLKPNNNKYFVNKDGKTVLEEYPTNLKKSKLALTNLVFPVHFEFGPSKKCEEDDFFRYDTSNQFKVGIGGYAGLRIGTRQKLKYEVDDTVKKDKIKNTYNTNNVVYGVSGYLAYGNIGLYAKYDISPLFKNQSIKQNNISLGLRFDLD